MRYPGITSRKKVTFDKLNQRDAWYIDQNLLQYGILRHSQTGLTLGLKCIARYKVLWNTSFYSRFAVYSLSEQQLLLFPPCPSILQKQVIFVPNCMLPLKPPSILSLLPNAQHVHVYVTLKLYFCISLKRVNNFFCTAFSVVYGLVVHHL